MRKPAKQVEVVLENQPTEDCTYERYLVDAAHCTQIMEKVDEVELKTGGSAQIRIALEPYAPTMIKLKTD